MISDEAIEALGSLHPLSAVVLFVSVLVGAALLRRMGLKMGERTFSETARKNSESAGRVSAEVAEAKRMNQAWLDATRTQEKMPSKDPIAEIIGPSRMPSNLVFEIGIDCRIPQKLDLMLDRKTKLKTLNFTQKSFIIVEVSVNEVGFHTLDLALPDGKFVSSPLEVVKG